MIRHLTDKQKIVAVERKLDHYIKPVNITLRKVAIETVNVFTLLFFLSLDFAFMYYILWLNKWHFFAGLSLHDDFYLVLKWIHGL
jgi:hypothetical protein